MKKEKIDKFMFHQVVINTRIGWNQVPHELNNGLQINVVDKLIYLMAEKIQTLQFPSPR